MGMSINGSVYGRSTRFVEPNFVMFDYDLLKRYKRSFGPIKVETKIVSVTNKKKKKPVFV